MLSLRSLVVVLLAVLVPAGVASAQDRPTRHALLVGINQYEHLQPLEFAEADMKELAELLRKYGYEVVLMLGSESGELRPTRRNIEKQLAALADRCKKGDTLVVAFTGHGVEFAGERKAYFCPIDGKRDKASVERLVSMAWVYEQVEQSVAWTKLLLIDACRDDPAYKGVRGVAAGSTVSPPTGTVALFSCGSTETALESRELRHGLFFHAVLQKLRGEVPGDKEVTVLALINHVTATVPGLARKYGEPGKTQSPKLDGTLEGSPLLLVLDRVVERTTANKPPRLRADLSEDWKTHQDALRRKGDTRAFLEARAPERARIWKSMAEDGDAQAMILYGDCLEEGKGVVAKNVVEATEWYRQAADKGLPRGQALYGLMLLRGSGVELNPRQGVEWLAKAADAGDEAGLFHLAWCYANGVGVAQDTTRAADLYEACVRKGDSSAAYALGACYYRGTGRPENRAEAVRLFVVAAEQGLVGAQFDAGNCYLNGFGVRKNHAEAVRWLSRAADQDHPTALAALADCYRYGLGVAKDEARAFELTVRAAERKSKEAVAWLQEAAGKGDGDAQLVLRRLGLPRK